MEVSSRGHSSKVKKDEASSKDAEIWKELLLNAQKGTTTEPYFIAKVGQSSLHTDVFCKIVLPAMFLDHHHKSLKEKIILEDSFKHRWPAMLGLTWQSKPCILHGWKEFAEDHNLQVGDQVVFFLVAKSHFMVQVFDADNNAKRRTPVTDQYNNPNISVPKGKTNKFSKSIENDEETSVRMKCNLNLQPKRLGETGATNDKSDAKHTSASVQVKIEGEAPDRSRLKPAATNLGPSSLGNIYTRCLTADGHEFFDILDTSEEECEKVTSNSERRRTTPRVKSPQISGKRKNFEVQTTPNSERSEEGHLNVKIRKVDFAEDAPLDGSLRYPPSKFHHPKHLNAPREVAETRPNLGNDNIMDRLLGKDTRKRTSSSEIKPSEHPVLENDSIMNRLLGIDTQKRSPSPEYSPFQHPVLENDSIMNRLLGKDLQKRSPSAEETISEPENDSIMNRLLGKDTQKRSPSPEKKSIEHPVLENDNIMNRLAGKDTQKRSPSPVKTPSEHPVLEIDSIMNTLLGRDSQKRRPSAENSPVVEHSVLGTDSIINKLVGTGGTAQAPDDIGPVSSKMGNIHQQQKKPQKEKITAELPNMGKKEPPRRSPSPPEDTPSSPEEALTLKRSRKLQRKSGGNYEGSEKFKADDCMARLARLERLLKLSQDRQIEMRGSTTSNSGSTQCKKGECNCKQKSRETMKEHSRRSASKDLTGDDSFLFCHCEQDVLRKKAETLQRMEHLFRKKIKETKVESRDGEVKHVKHPLRDDAPQPVLEKVKERHHQVHVNEDVVTKGTKREGATTAREVSVDRRSGEKTLLKKDNWLSRKKVSLPEVPTELVMQQPLVRRDDQNTSTTVKPKLFEPREHKETLATELLQKPGGLEGRHPVKSRHKVMMGSKDSKSCRSPITDPMTPNPIPSPPPQAKPVYKRPPRKVRAPKPPPLLYISKRRPVTAEEREDALAQANAYAQKVTNQKFVMQLKTNQVYCGFHLKVPQEFVDALQMPPRTMNMTLCDLTGKTWEVEWLSDEPGQYGFRSAGWTRFVLEHFLEEGDVCVFDLPDPQHFHILVHIFPVVELVEIPPNGWQSHYTLAADIPNSDEVLKRPL